MPYRNTPTCPTGFTTDTVQLALQENYSNTTVSSPLALQILATCTTGFTTETISVTLQKHCSHHYSHTVFGLQVHCRNDYRQHTTDFSFTTASPIRTTASLDALTTGCTTDGAVLHYSIGSFVHYSHLDMPLQQRTCWHAVVHYSTVGMCSDQNTA